MISERHPQRSQRLYQKTQGLSLVEILVAMVIGLFLVVGATTVYVNSRKSSDVDDAVARLQETARYAMNVIETDVRMANFWGLAKNGAAIVNKPSQLSAPNPSAAMVASITGLTACGATYSVDVEKYVEGSNNQYSPVSCAASTGAVATADTLTVRRAAIAASTAVDSTKLQICSNRNHTAIINGGTCTDEIHDLIVNHYYVDRQSSLSSSLPSLHRRQLITGPTFRDDEIIPGVEDIQVQFGWDSTGTSARAEQYVNPDSAVLAGGQIVAVRVWILVRAESADPAYRDARQYEYGDRAATNGSTSDLSAAGSAAYAYVPNDNYRRLLVSRTIFVRNAVGT